MAQLIFSGVTGMTLPYDIYGCDYYGNNCILIATIYNPPPVTLTLPPIFDGYRAINVKLSNCINCDYSEFIACGNFIPQIKQFQNYDDFEFQDSVIYVYQT